MLNSEDCKLSLSKERRGSSKGRVYIDYAQRPLSGNKLSALKNLKIGVAGVKRAKEGKAPDGAGNVGSSPRECVA